MEPWMLPEGARSFKFAHIWRRKLTLNQNGKKWAEKTAGKKPPAETAFRQNSVLIVVDPNNQ